MFRPQESYNENDSQLLSLLALGAVIYNTIAIPIRVAFEVPILGPWLVVDIIADLIYIVDYLKGWNQNPELAQRLSRRSAYYHKRGPKEAIASIPFDYFILALGMGAIGAWWIPLLRVNRLLRMSYPFEMVQQITRRRPHSEPIFRMLRILMLVAIMSHCYACAWYFLGVKQEAGSSWVIAEELSNSSLWSRYLHCIYWAITTITTVGYGDITPETDAEMLFTLGVMITGVLLWAYVIGVMSWMVSNMDYLGTVYRNKLNRVSQFLQHHNVSQELGDHINEYYEYLWSQHLVVSRDEIMADLPESLRVQVAMELNKEIVSKVPFFNGCEPGFIESLVTMLKPQVFCPGDTVIHRGGIGKEMYFINSGEVQIIGDDGKTVLKVCRTGSFFGEMALLFSQQRSATVKATTFCELYMLTKKDFEEVLQSFPRFAERVYSISHSRVGGEGAAAPRDPTKAPASASQIPIQQPEKDQSVTLSD